MNFNILIGIHNSHVFDQTINVLMKEGKQCDLSCATKDSSHIESRLLSRIASIIKS